MKTLSKLLVALFMLMAFPQSGEAAFTANKQYNNQTTGSNINTWGIVLNSNFTTIDNNLGGTLTLSVAGNSNVTLTVTQAQSLIYDFTGVLTGNIVIYFPAQGGFYYVNNQTTGAYTITIESTGDSSGIIVPQGGGLPIIVDNSTSPPTTFSPNYASAGANSNITSLTGLTTPLSAAQGGSSIYVGGTSGGSANAQTLATVVPANFALTAGNIVTGIAGYTNSGAATLAVNSLAATAQRKLTPTGLLALSGGEIVSGQAYVWLYDGTYYELINPSTNQFTSESTLASATSTNLGTATSNVVDITGTTTITGFGSSATTANPLYFIRFTGALTLTYNATSLIVPGAANITTAAGDTAVAKYEGSGNWRIINYTTANPGVTAGSYTTANITVNALGQVTSAANGSSALSSMTNSLGNDVTLTSQSTFYDGPSIGQGGTGTWCGGGQVTVAVTNSNDVLVIKLWDGTTVINEIAPITPTNNQNQIYNLYGCLASPAGNIKMSVEDITRASGGTIKYNISGSSKDSTLTLVRIQ